ncbi:MAG: VCBS repeat-containing protein [Opitutus sp.]
MLCVLSGCGRSSPPVAAAKFNDKPATVLDLNYLKRQDVGAPISRPPWIANVCPVDLDKDGSMDVVACEAQTNQVLWIRQTSRGAFEEKILASDLRAPVHVDVTDIDGDGDLDILVASMAVVFPHNDRIGTVFILENDGHQNFSTHKILENTSRVTDIRAADFNGDGRIDLALAQFGYDQGEVSWLERIGPWEFKRHVILDLSGAINVCVADFDGDGKPDIAAILSQQWEEVYLFRNDGKGNFGKARLWGSTNEDYGSSGLSVADLNRDGRPDLIFSNGDGFGPSATPGPRPWHGVQWLENKGEGNFAYHRVGLLPGAYSPICVDLDGDGAMDIVACSAYSDWNNKNRNVISLMWFRNDGKLNFEPHALSRTPKDIITLAAGDFDGNGRPVLVTGGFYIYPPYDSMSRIALWRH